MRQDDEGFFGDRQETLGLLHLVQVTVFGLALLLLVVVSNP